MNDELEVLKSQHHELKKEYRRRGALLKAVVAYLEKLDNQLIFLRNNAGYHIEKILKEDGLNDS